MNCLITVYMAAPDPSKTDDEREKKNLWHAQLLKHSTIHDELVVIFFLTYLDYLCCNVYVYIFIYFSIIQKYIYSDCFAFSKTSLEARHELNIR